MKTSLGLALSCLFVWTAGCSKPQNSLPSAAAAAAANSQNQQAPQLEERRSLADTSKTDPANSAEDTAQRRSVRLATTGTGTDILLFNGVGISTSDWQSLENIIRSMGLTYTLVNSSALNAMTLDQLRTFKVILIPGGNSNTINTALPASTMIRVRQAVRDYGVSYLGICAGAFDAVGQDALSNTTAYYGFAVALGDWLKFWYPNGNTNAWAAIVPVTFADGTRRYMTWYDGPYTTAWPGGVIARYADGKPAISQTWNNKGFVIISGVHPEAPANWQYDTGTDPDGLDTAIAVKLIRAAVNRAPLPAN